MSRRATELSAELLVKPKDHAMLYRTFRDATMFDVWRGKLYWMGRMVEKLYSMASLRRWWSVPMSFAIKWTLDHGNAQKVLERPRPYDGLPS